MPKIDIRKALETKDVVFVDVRSPKEFEEDHIPNAINMPILDDVERHLVGLTYKQESKDKAVGMGYEIFDRKIKVFEDFVEDNKDKNVVFYCFRGGLRSGCFLDYFQKKGKEVYQLERGYKAYRESVREQLETINLPKNVIVLYGLTGAGKTQMIKRLGNAVDLEGLAAHRSSLFGAVGLEPRSQKMFETMLLEELKKNRDYLILEGESRKVGDALIPLKIYESMINGIKIDVTCSVETRAKRIVDEYFISDERIEQVKEVTKKMKERLGIKKVEELLKLLDEKDYFTFSKILLLEYYDPLYTHAVKEFSFSKRISSEDLDEAVRQVEEFCKTLPLQNQ